MAFHKFTRMVERKAKDGPRGELRAFAFRGVSPVWVSSQHVACVGTFEGYVTNDDYELDERDICEIRLSGSPDALYVSEPIDEVLQALGIASE